MPIACGSARRGPISNFASCRRPSTSGRAPRLPITVHALRRDGFNGPIDLVLKDAPTGFSLSGAKIPAGQAKVRLTLTVPLDPGRPPTALHMEGRAMIAGGEVRHPAVPADDMMQAYYYRHWYPPSNGWSSIIGRGRGAIPFKVGSQKKVKLPSGGTADLHFIGPHGPMVKMVQLTLSEPPDGLSIQKTTATDDGVVVVLRADSAKLKPGWKGNVIIEASVDRVPDSKNAKFKPVKRRFSWACCRPCRWRSWQSRCQEMVKNHL